MIGHSKKLISDMAGIIIDSIPKKDDPEIKNRGIPALFPQNRSQNQKTP